MESLKFSHYHFSNLRTLHINLNSGPLTYKRNGRAYVVGVVSWGIGCGRSDAPGIYSRVSIARPWIDEQLAITC